MRAVLFDMDGVLLDSYDAWYHLLRQALRDLAGADITPETFARTWGQGVDADVEMFFPRHSAAEVGRYYEEHFAAYARLVKVTPDAAEVLDALRARGTRTAVITNTPAPLAHQMLTAAALRADVVVGGLDVPRAKPAPDIVLRACELLAVGVGEVLVVGDSEYDRDAAAAAGARFAGYHLETELELQSLRELLEIPSEVRVGRGTGGG